MALEGCLDVATAPQAIQSLQRFVEEHGPDVVIDTSRLDFIDSKGVGALLTGAKAAKDAGGHLALPNPALPVRKILETCGLMPLFAPRAAAPAAPVAAESAPAEAAPKPRKAAGTRAPARAAAKTE
ncbi:MAG TPA: STAS domain-containing protein [Armatimonadota bacterium]|nr:STAS domain-containing protein [Armatimonadota bacterium]